MAETLPSVHHMHAAHLSGDSRQQSAAERSRQRVRASQCVGVDPHRQRIGLARKLKNAGVLFPVSGF